MNDSIDQTAYNGDLYARVNDGDKGEYAINHPLEKLGCDRDHVVLSWDKDEPLLIHTDLKTCQMCGNRMRYVTEKDCEAKRCESCGWSVMKNGFPSLVKLPHEYLRLVKGGKDVSFDIDPTTGEVIPSRTSEIKRFNELGHMHRKITPDATVSIGDCKSYDRLPEAAAEGHAMKKAGGIVDDDDELDEEVIEGLSGGQTAGIVFGVGGLIALAVFIYRVVQNGSTMSGVQIVIELCAACCFSWLYVIVICIMMAMGSGQPQSASAYPFRSRR